MEAVRPSCVTVMQVPSDNSFAVVSRLWWVRSEAKRVMVRTCSSSSAYMVMSVSLGAMGCALSSSLCSRFGAAMSASSGGLGLIRVLIVSGSSPRAAYADSGSMGRDILHEDAPCWRGEGCVGPGLVRSRT